MIFLDVRANFKSRTREFEINSFEYLIHDKNQIRNIEHILKKISKFLI